MPPHACHSRVSRRESIAMLFMQFLSNVVDSRGTDVIP